MALQAGSVTIKTSGGTYSSWAAFWDDIGDLTGNITCTVDASAFTETTAPAVVTESLNGHTLHVKPSTFPTTTDASTGARFTCSYTPATGYNILTMSMEGSGSVIIEGLVFIQGTDRPNYAFFTSNIATSFSFTLRRNIVKGCNYGYTNSDSTLNNDLKLYNNIFYNNVYNGMRGAVDLTNALIANNTFVDCAVRGLDVNGYNLTVQNCIAYDSSSYDIWGTADATGYNNASGDATGEDADWNIGSDNLTSISDPFNALASDDFTITAEGDIGNAGKDLSASFTDDFFGVTRDNWTIGACEYVTPPFYSVSVVGSRDIQYHNINS